MVDGSKILRRLLSIAIIFLLIVPNFIVPVSAATEAKMIFSYNFDGVQINTVDTNSAGTLTFAGLSNGSVICMDNNGIIIYNKKPTGFVGSIKNLESDDNGNVAVITDAGEMAWITFSGTETYINRPIGFNASDIAIGKTNNFFFINWNNSAASMLYGISSVGEVKYQNTSPSILNFYQQVEYDSINGIVVVTNGSYTSFPSNMIYLFNVSTYIGWLQFNPARLVKNATLQFFDSFPYRQNISYNNGNTATVSLEFLDNVSTSCTNITKYPNGTYSFNVTRHGNYFFWGYPGSVNTSQKYVNLSYYNATLRKLTVSTLPSTSPGNNTTFYFGKSSYTNLIVNNSISYKNNNTLISQGITSGSTWTVPSYVYGVNLTMYGGGGGGSAGQDYEVTGDGGDASSVTVYSNIKVSPGSYANVSIGGGGAGSLPAWTPPTADGSTGGTTTFSNGTVYSATGGSGGHTAGAGPGGAGYTGYPGYPTADTGGNGYSKEWSCSGGFHYNYGSAGGTGFGAGGGGAGGANYPTSYCEGNMPGSGGTGAPGIIIASFYVNDIPIYFNGTLPTSPLLAIQENENIDSTILLTGTLSLTGNATAISIPEGGGIVGVSTAGPTSGVVGKLYHIIITTMGFGAQYSGASDIGIPVQVATSDSGTYSIEARGSWIDIYQLDGTLKGQYNTGGLVNSVDISDRNGLWAVAGGTDGIFYIFDKAATSGWEVYYQGDSKGAINSVAVTEAGVYAAVGRADGSFEYYDIKSTIATAEAIFSADLFVTRGGSPLPNVNISIIEFSNAIPSLVTGNNITTITDTNGHYVFTVTERNYYNISVNNGESYQLYHASPTYKVIAINLPFPVMIRPFQYGATYDSYSNVITSTYSDVNNAYVNLSVIDSTSRTLKYSQIYPSTTGFVNNYVVPDANKTYRVQFDIVRTTGAKYSDTIYLQSSIFNAIPKNTSDQYTLFIYAVYTIMLMIVALSIGTQSLKYGTVMLVALTFLGITLGFLPLSLYTVGIATSAFIALLEVYRRRE